MNHEAISSLMAYGHSKSAKDWQNVEADDARTVPQKRKTQEPWTATDQQTMIDLLEKGWNVECLAASMGRPASTVHYHKRKTFNA